MISDVSMLSLTFAISAFGNATFEMLQHLIANAVL